MISCLWKFKVYGILCINTNLLVPLVLFSRFLVPLVLFSRFLVPLVLFSRFLVHSSSLHALL